MWVTCHYVITEVLPNLGLNNPYLPTIVILMPGWRSGRAPGSQKSSHTNECCPSSLTCGREGRWFDSSSGHRSCPLPGDDQLDFRTWSNLLSSSTKDRTRLLLPDTTAAVWPNREPGPKPYPLQRVSLQKRRKTIDDTRINRTNQSVHKALVPKATPIICEQSEVLIRASRALPPRPVSVAKRSIYPY